MLKKEVFAKKSAGFLQNCEFYSVFFIHFCTHNIIIENK